MKILFILVLIILGFLFYPQFNEDTGSSCAALEGKVVRLVTEDTESSLIAALILKGFSSGGFAREMIKSKYPNLPPIIGCSIFYYEILFNPKIAQNLKSDL